MADFELAIDGKAVAADNTFPVINPATGEPFAEAPDASRAQLDAAMEAAQRAFAPWAADEKRRREALVACADALGAAIEEIAPVLTREQGKPVEQAAAEVGGGSRNTRRETSWSRRYCVAVSGLRSVSVASERSRSPSSSVEPSS